MPLLKFFKKYSKTKFSKTKVRDFNYATEIMIVSKANDIAIVVYFI